MIGETDVLYVTPCSKSGLKIPSKHEELKGSYVVTTETLRQAKDKMIVMHPLPRVWEIDMAVDDDPRAAYFRQMEYACISAWRCWRWCWEKPDRSHNRLLKKAVRIELSGFTGRNCHDHLFFEKLDQRAREIDSLLCVGLDPHPEDLPEQTAQPPGNFACVDEATKDYALAFKPNAAFLKLWERRGGNFAGSH